MSIATGYESVSLILLTLCLLRLRLLSTTTCFLITRSRLLTFTRAILNILNESLTRSHFSTNGLTIHSPARHLIVQSFSLICRISEMTSTSSTTRPLVKRKITFRLSRVSNVVDIVISLSSSNCSYSSGRNVFCQCEVRWKERNYLMVTSFFFYSSAAD